MKKLASTALILCVMAIAVGVLLALDFRNLKKIDNDEITDINTLTPDSIEEGQLINGDMSYLMDCFAEQYETKFGIRSSSGSTNLYYIYWIDTDSFLVLETSLEDSYGTLDKICEETWTYIDAISAEDATEESVMAAVPTTSIPFEGEICTMSDDIRDLCYDWFLEYTDYTESELDSAVEVYMLRARDFDSMRTGAYVGVGLIIFGVLGVVVYVIVVLKKKRASKEDFY